MLERVIGEDIQLITIFNQKAGQVKVDPGQLSQIIMNLAVNARDAMPQGGTLTFETDNVTLDEEYALHHISTIPGEYVMMAVSDTGTGMNDKTIKHLFEPFFTTKEVGKGTGLGLATVYGIVKQSGGYIWVYSEEGVGTTFKVYFPRVVEESVAEEAKNTFEELPRGTETILLVEDEEMVRSLARQILEECGYTVLEANNGVEAMSMCENHDCQVDLLMTDVVMPQMGGRELAERFAEIYPQIRILFTSGYTDDAVVRNGVIEAGTNFIQKPFTLDALARKIREVLDKS
jgi:CheY-like chemotaxis protein